MTTDNRTNEPSEAQVEAAARAIADNLFSRWTLTSRVSASKDRGSLIHVAARAALEAAVGVAPPAPSEYAYCPIHGDLLAANRSYRCGNAPTGHEYATTVQPSSTVDEGKLSEVIEDAIIDNLKPENTITGFYVPFGRVSDIASVAARAVVEAIGGEGRGE